MKSMKIYTPSDYEIYGRSIIICKKIGSVAKGKG